VKRGILVASATLLCFCSAAVAQVEDSNDEAVAFFESRIRPVLAEHCYGCHSNQADQQRKLKGGLLLDSREGSRRGGDSGPAVVPGKPQESLLLSALRHESFEMPPKGKLPDTVIEDFERWIRTGAADPRDAPAKAAVVAIDLEKGRKFWSFQPLQPATPPAVKDKHKAWPRTPIDQFVLARQQAAGLKPNDVASARTLVRRAWFDLLGLPPTPEEMEAWIKRLTHDQSGAAAQPLNDQAYAEMIDYLLASPHYGERWARHWMDVARFAESHGYEQDYDRPNAYHYRDFLIQAFNADMPFDQFVRWQLAGDELAPDDPLALAATGFLGAGAFPTQLTEMEFESARYDELDDMVATTGVAMLGLSIGCARCHDHKFDPIPSRDYYRLAATFTTAIRTEVTLDRDRENNARRQAAYDAQLARLSAHLDHFADLEAADRSLASLLGEWQGFQALAAHRKQGPGLNLTKMMIVSEGLPHLAHHADGRGFPHFYPQTHVLRRGDVHQKGDVAPPGFLQVLLREDYPAERWTERRPAQPARTSHRRAALAHWLTDSEHGAGHLAARVAANRLWQHHFGRGIVATPNDFGASGERPTQPELLDWLAADLVEHGWRLKRLHKLIMTSSTYLQSNDFDEARAQIDPENRLLWRRAPRRLEAEAIRDAMLAVSGQLDMTMYGPGTLDPDMRRRSIYFFIKRSKLIPMMMLFDWPEHLVSIGQRSTTTIAPQALLFMNSPQGRRYAESLAGRVMPVTSEMETVDARQSIDNAYHLALGRKATLPEMELSVAFLERQMQEHARQGYTHAAQQALADFCQTLLSTNEFVYVD
jgi:hypothetical protein